MAEDTGVECGGIETSVVTAGPPAAVGLGHDVQWAGPGRAGRPDDAHLLHLAELLSGNSELLSSQAAWAHRNWRTVGGDDLFDAVCRAHVDAKVRYQHQRKLIQETGERGSVGGGGVRPADSRSHSVLGF